MANKVDAKVVLLGKEYSGKTCLVERYLHGRFNKDVPYQNVSVLLFRPVWGLTKTKKVEKSLLALGTNFKI